MLSRVAEKLYWMARYIERTENTARLIRSYNRLILDIPVGSEPSWLILADILDAKAEFKRAYSDISEQNVHRFLIRRKTAKTSLHFSIIQARENIRTTRDVLPEDAWELINEIFIFVSDEAKKTSSRRARLIFLDRLIQHTQTLSGLLETTLYRDHTYCFMKLGTLTERADMTTRILDVGAGDILKREGDFSSIEPILWAALLETMSAKSAFRRLIGPVIEKDNVIDFIANEKDFPRSISHCLNETKQVVSSLPNHKETSHLLDRIRRKVRRFKSSNRQESSLHKFISSLQVNLTELDNEIHIKWFVRNTD